MCQKCYKFFPYRPEINSHRAFCIIKQALEVRNSGTTSPYPASATPEPVIVTQQGHKSASAQSLKQLIQETLRSSMEYTNAAGMCQTAATGQCPDDMNCTQEPDNQYVKIIPGDTRYWQDWENEV